MTRTTIKLYSFIREYQKRLNQVLVCGCLLLVLSYGVNLYSVITKTVALQKTESQILASENQTQKLDAEYISLSSGITPEMAKNYGLKETPVSSYINRVASLGRFAVRVSNL